MSSFPPLTEVIDALFRCVLPTGAVAAVVFSLVTGLVPKRLSGLAVALALTLAFIQGNYLREPIPTGFEPDFPFSFANLAMAAAHALVRPEPTFLDTGKMPEPVPLTATALYWVPWAAAMALFTDLLLGLPRVPEFAGWIVRPLVALMASRLLLPQYLHSVWPWRDGCLAAVILAIWFVGRGLERRQAGGWLALTLAMSSFVAAFVLTEALSLRLTDVALIGFAALAGLSLAAWRSQEQTRNVSGAVAMTLPSLLLITQQETFSEVPLLAFVLAGVSPVVLAALLLPRVNRLSGRWLPLAAFGLVLIPAVVAVVVTLRAATGQ